MAPAAQVKEREQKPVFIADYSPSARLEWNKHWTPLLEKKRTQNVLGIRIVVDKTGSSSTNVPSKFVIGTTDFKPQQHYSAMLAEIQTRRFSSPKPLTKVGEFNPSNILAQYLVHENNEDQLTVDEAKQQLKRLVRSFIGTVSDSLRPLSVTHLQLTENGRFRDNVARALLHRFSVDLYEQANFLNLLQKEMTPVAESGQFGTASGLLTKTDGELIVKQKEHKAHPLFSDVQWIKASIPRR